MNNIKAFIYKDMKRNATFKVLLMFIVGLFLSVIIPYIFIIFTLFGFAYKYLIFRDY